MPTNNENAVKIDWIGSMWIWRGNTYTVLGHHEGEFGRGIYLSEDGSDNRFVQTRSDLDAYIFDGWSDPIAINCEIDWNKDGAFITDHEILHARAARERSYTLGRDGRLVLREPPKDPFIDIPGAHAALRKAGVK
jgi:hypothetical protein